MQKNLLRPITRYLTSGAYIRMQNIQLGYTVPQSLVSKLHIQKLRVYFSGENLLTFSHLPKGFDPVALFGYTEGFGGNDLGIGRTYGADRIYSFGISVTY